MICEPQRFVAESKDRTGKTCGLRRLCEILPEIMARYDSRRPSQPHCEMVHGPPVGGAIDVRAVTG